MPMIFSTHTLHPKVTARLQAAGDYRVASAPTAEAIMAEGLDADILVVRAPIPEAYFTAAGNLRAAVRHGAGLDMIPVDVATAAGVLVANVPGVNAVTVAEHVVFSTIGLLRQFRAMDIALRSKGWSEGRAFSDHGHDLSGRTIGIFGMGNIGREVSRLAQALGMPVISTTRRPETLPAHVEAVSLDALCARSDVLVLCCPLNSETRGAINATRIASMQPGSVLVNVARGPVVDTAALIEALRQRQILGAALDVFDAQPLPGNHPLFDLNNVILTPHMAGITADSMLRMGMGAADETVRILAGDLPLNFCNPEVSEPYRSRFPD